MATTVDTQVPEILLPTPKPELHIRKFHRRQLHLWEGDVPTEKVRGWVKNRRTELHVQLFREQTGRDPDDDELYEAVLEDDEQKIKLLAENIAKNDVRVPIILAADGRLIDGNRRYFAVKFLRDNAKASNRGEYDRIPAWVLSRECGPDDEFDVITERNVAEDYKEPWPYWVVARWVYEDQTERGFTVKQIAEKYDMQASRVRAMIAAVELAEEFIAFHEERDPARASRVVYDNLIWFDQLRRSHGKLLDEDPEFKEAAFEMMFEDPPRFKRATDLRDLGYIRRSKRAWATLLSVPGREGLKCGNDELAAERAHAARNPVAKLERVTELLTEIARAPELATAHKNLLDNFHRLATLVPAGPSDVEWQVDRMQRWLDEMTTEQVSRLSKPALEKLGRSQKRVEAMAKAWPKQA